MPVEEMEIVARSPVSQLSEEELLLQETVRRFARKQIAPLVKEMDEQQKMSPRTHQTTF